MQCVKILLFDSRLLQATGVSFAACGVSRTAAAGPAAASLLLFIFT
jgi:hypothetical protein